MANISALRRLRFEAGELSLNEAAALLGVERSTLNRIERGEAKASLEFLEALKASLGVSLDDAKALCDGALPPEKFRPLVAALLVRHGAAGASVGDDKREAGTERDGAAPAAAAGVIA